MADFRHSLGYSGSPSWLATSEDDVGAILANCRFRLTKTQRLPRLLANQNGPETTLQCRPALTDNTKGSC